MRLQSEFPDCKAMRRVDEKRWQEVWIELEFESRNFLTHMHDVAGCDLIVCWEHNWPECPLEVVELKKVVKGRRWGKWFFSRGDDLGVDCIGSSNRW